MKECKVCGWRQCKAKDEEAKCPYGWKDKWEEAK